MKGKILIIEDEFELCLLLKLHLISREYQVEMAYNLQDGLKKLEDYSPDVVFLDNNLPDGNGWDSITKIAEKYPQVQINLITGAKHEYFKYADIKNLFMMEKPLSKKEIDEYLNLFEDNKFLLNK
ncbi:response regulator [Ferruginibacter albus]|uniref:response regulator n=1 Tax=Ferruginibacter albus TaxID=2875540 RepID=UPI001CC39A44|nr:response regulator [Ferruginibacter albus]UAY52850.1 response regulator [Ferruginibacter albus]